MWHHDTVNDAGLKVGTQMNGHDNPWTRRKPRNLPGYEELQCRLNFGCNMASPDERISNSTGAERQRQLLMPHCMYFSIRERSGGSQTRE